MLVVFSARAFGWTFYQNSKQIVRQTLIKSSAPLERSRVPVVSHAVIVNSPSFGHWMWHWDACKQSPLHILTNDCPREPCVRVTGDTMAITSCNQELLIRDTESGKYRYLILMCCGLSLLATGSIGGWSVFNKPIADTFSFENTWPSTAENNIEFRWVQVGVFQPRHNFVLFFVGCYYYCWWSHTRLGSPSWQGTYTHNAYPLTLCWWTVCIACALTGAEESVHFCFRSFIF